MHLMLVHWYTLLLHILIEDGCTRIRIFNVNILSIFCDISEENSAANNYWFVVSCYTAVFIINGFEIRKKHLLKVMRVQRYSRHYRSLHYTGQCHNSRVQGPEMYQRVFSVFIIWYNTYVLYNMYNTVCVLHCYTFAQLAHALALANSKDNF